MDLAIGYKGWILIFIAALSLLHIGVVLLADKAKPGKFSAFLFTPVLKIISVVVLLLSFFATGYKLSGRIIATESIANTNTGNPEPKYSLLSVKDMFVSPDMVRMKSVKDSSELKMVLKDIYEKHGKISLQIGRNDPEFNAFIFSSVLSHLSAPYGFSNERNFTSLIKEDSLDCDNYAMLTIYIFETLFPNHSGKYEIVGFDGGAVGNHAQLFYKKDTTSFLVDPCFGFVAPIDYNGLLKGRPVPANKIYYFNLREEPKLRFSLDNALQAVTGGKYNPDDLLYYFDNVDSFSIYSNKFSGFEEMIGSFKTPAGQKMYNRLIHK